MIRVVDLKKHYPVVSGIRSIFSKSRGQTVKAVDALSFEIPAGGVLGLVGESGCGKTTTGRVLVGLESPTSGDVFFQDENLQALCRRDRKAFYSRVQMIFQDPYGSINPQHDVARVIATPLIYQGRHDRRQVSRKTCETLETVGLSPPEEFLKKYPHQLSGGQRQRLCIGRAIIIDPRFIVADEPISMLDVSIKSGIITLLRTLIRSLALPFIVTTLYNLCFPLLLMRGSMLETFGEDFIELCRMKGMPERRVIYRHAMRNSFLPIATTIPLVLGWAVAGSVVIETVFSWPGLGLLMIESIQRSDYPVVQACFLLIAVLTIAGNFAADLIYGVLDPRIVYN